MKQRVVLFIISFLSTAIAFTQGTTEVAATTAAPAKPGFSLQDLTIIATMLLVFIVSFLIIYQLMVMRNQMKRLQKQIANNDPKAILDEPTWMERFFERFVGLKPMEMEGELIMDDHEYDGIVELKNGMPPWLQAFFLVTVIFAVSYWTYYMVLKAGPDQYQEYQMQLDKAKKEKEERNKLFSNSIDENNVVLATDETELAQGKKLFIDNCATCHKDHGGGDSGPNLTDEFWIHGGGIKNVFLTVKTGFIEKGMPGWGDKLNPLQIQQVSSFVLSLQGTNPAGGKAPQGELWTGDKTNSDSTATKTDSLKVDSMVPVQPIK